MHIAVLQYVTRFWKKNISYWEHLKLILVIVHVKPDSWLQETHLFCTQIAICDRLCETLKTLHVSMQILTHS